MKQQQHLKQNNKGKQNHTERKKQIRNWSDLREYFDKHTFKRFSGQDGVLQLFT